MRPWRRLFGCSLLLVVLVPDVCRAVVVDKKNGKWSLLGRLKLEATFRTVDTPENNPIPIEAGDLVTQRNLLFLEWRHDLGKIAPWLSFNYFLQFRFFYDSAWDVGPDVLKDDETRRYYLFDNRDQINDLKWDADLFLGYFDLTGGPVFVRVGRQVMSWGEMTTLRILDGINPTDNTSLAVDLLERLVPLFMVRVNLAFEYVGPFSSVSVEGYYVPGKIENTNGEEIIDGSPIIPPVGRNTVEDLKDPLSLASLTQITQQVEDTYDADRYGAKLGLMFQGLEMNFAYYRAYSDIPVPFLDVDGFQPIYLSWRDILSIDLDDPFGSILKGQKLDVILKIDKVDVFGGSFNYNWGWIDTVIRGEMALFKNVPKMTPGSVRDMIEGLGSKVYLPPPLDGITLADILRNIDLGDIEDEILPFTSGQLTTFDELRYGIGLDKWTKFPRLSREDFLLIFEYVGKHILGYREKTILQPWRGPNDEVIYEPEWSNTFLLIVSTNYLNGNLTPRLVTMYEIEPKALSLIPSVAYDWRTLTFEVSYFHTISDTYEGRLGMLESRNEVSFNFIWSF
jgi:Protein of unknown function (DUF1302)